MKATESDSNTIVDGAVGVVTRGDGRVLLAERPQGKPSAGYRQEPQHPAEPGVDFAVLSPVLPTGTD